MEKAQTLAGVHTTKFIKQSKGEKAFIGDEVKGRLNLLSRI